MGRPAKLTDQQRMFCVYYVLEGMSAKQAYLKAYPESAETSASPNAHRLMQKPHVKAEIERLMEEQKTTLDISDKVILQGIAQIAFNEDIAPSTRLQALDKLAKINKMYEQEITVNHQVIKVGIVDDVPKLEDNNNGQIIGSSFQEIEPCIIIDDEDEEKDSEE